MAVSGARQGHNVSGSGGHASTDAKPRHRSGGHRMRRSLVWLLVFSWTLAGPLAGPEAKPKLGPDAVPITREAGYLHSAPAPDYWKLSAFYVPQFTTSACSV